MNNKKSIIIAVIIALLVLVLAICLFLYIKESNRHKNNVSVGKIDDTIETNKQSAFKIEEGMRIEPNITVADLKEKLESTSEIEIKNSNGETMKESDIIGTGTTIESNSSQYRVVVVGDVNGDGKLTITDIVKLNLHMLKIEELDEFTSKAADITGDEKITITDVTIANLANIRIKDIKEYVNT